MKLSSFLLIAMFFLACKNNQKFKQTVKNEDGTTTTTTVDVASLTSSAEDMNGQVEKLKKLQPLTLEQLKAMLPEEINGIKRKSYSTNSAMGASVGEAEYEKDENTNIKLVIYDCAGEMGAGVYGMTYLAQMSMQSENDKGYVKTVEFNGGKALESFQKEGNESAITYFAKDRLLIVVTGKNVDPNAVKEIAKNLPLKVI